MITFKNRYLYKIKECYEEFYMKKLIGLFSLIVLVSCSPNKPSKTTENLNSNEPTILNGENGLNIGLIPTDGGLIDLNKKTKIEYQGEFRRERPLDTKLVLSHDELDFGMVNNHQVVGYRISVKNIGVDEATNIKLSTAQDFYTGSDRCSGLSLKTDEVCTFRILFTGKDKLNNKYEGSVTVYGDVDAQASAKLVAEVGQATSIQLESLQGTNISFNSKSNKEVIRNLRIVNRGPGVAEKMQVKTYSGEFQVLNNGCEGSSLSKNQYCTITLSFNPQNIPWEIISLS